MRFTKKNVVSVLAAFLLVFVSLSVAAEIDITLRFEGMDAYAGKPLFVRLVDEQTQVEVSRWYVAVVPDEPFDLALEGLLPEQTYRVDVFVDLNENSRYDAPPVDAAWRIVLPDLSSGEIVAFTPPDDLTDIHWAPRIDGSIDAGEYANVLEDPQTGMTLSWSNDDTVLHIGLVSPGTGWLSVGFAPQRRMLGANIIIASVEEGELQIEEHYGSSQTAHRRDDEEHILQAAGSLTEHGTVLEFSILLDSGDPQDALLEPGTEIVVILAYHSSRTDFRVGHTRRSTVTIALD